MTTQITPETDQLLAPCPSCGAAEHQECLPTALALPDLSRSASYAAPWTRALEAGLRKHGATPLYDALVTETGVSL